MKKTTLIITTVCSLIFAFGTAWALPTAYEGRTQGEPALTQTKDLGYYLWSNDDQTQWHLRWTGGSKTTRYKFQGQIFLSGSSPEFSGNNLTTDLYKFEKADRYTQTANNAVEFTAFASGGKDGFDFTITGDPLAVSYICFDLNIKGIKKAKTTTPLNFYSLIYLGDLMGNPASKDFKIAFSAPAGNVEAVHTPEPATMLLLGSGLVGLAGLGRKKIKSRP